MIEKTIIERVLQIISDNSMENGWAQQAFICKKCKDEGIDTSILGRSSKFFESLSDYIETDKDNNGLPILKVKKQHLNPYIEYYQRMDDLGRGWKNFDKFKDSLISDGIASNEQEIIKELKRLAPHLKFFDKDYKIDENTTCRAFRANELTIYGSPVNSCVYPYIIDSL